MNLPDQSQDDRRDDNVTDFEELHVGNRNEESTKTSAANLLSTPGDREAIDLAHQPEQTPNASIIGASLTSWSHKDGSGWYDGLQRWWQRNISVKAPVEKRRDHLALERTFLGYLRTSLAFAITGVVVAQLFRLDAKPGDSSMSTSYARVATPLSGGCIIVALIILLLGACRFFRIQAAMMRGKTLAGGWEIYTVMFLSIATSCVLLGLVASLSDSEEG